MAVFSFELVLPIAKLKNWDSMRTTSIVMPFFRSTFFVLLGCLLISFLGGCAKDRPLVEGFFEPGGIIYREDEKEEWGSRSTVKVLGGEF
jgi:hypothetical protein